MEKGTIKKNVHELLLKLFKIKKINSNTLFINNDKIDSLNLLNLYSLLEKKYKIKFKSSELVNLTSIENILRIINGKINEKKKRK
tara:strand:+ start:6656 stop:6910 length:255 start_codon:yes stop_codon:yes gene_type:complete